MDSKKYIVTCLACKQSSRLQIVGGGQVIYVDHVPIIAARLRGDMEWGFECMCGNDSRLARQEFDQAKMLVAGSGKAVIDRVLESLKIEDKLKFSMETA